jgi:hypothetical protein
VAEESQKRRTIAQSSEGGDRAVPFLFGPGAGPTDGDTTNVDVGRRGWVAHRGQQQTAVDRSAIDKSIAGQHGGSLGKAEAVVRFENTPRNVKTRANGTGAFKDIRLERTPAMNTTGTYGTDSANYAAEE